jgi:HEAT repeat protein
VTPAGPAASEGIGRVLGSRGRDPLVRVRSARNPADRARGALALAELDSPRATAALRDALGDASPEVREAAALALASLRDPASIPSLVAIVARWADPSLARARRAALRALVAFRSEGAALELARSLVEARPGAPVALEDRSALLAVVHAEPTGVAAARVVRDLLFLLGHPNPACGDRAAALLMLFPADTASPLARALRTSPAAGVRRRAARALRACRQDEAVAALVAALEDPVAGVRAAAARSLGEMRDPAAAAALARVAGDADRDVREAVRAALSALGAGAAASGMAAGLRRLPQTVA